MCSVSAGNPGSIESSASDTRAALRSFFEIDRHQIVLGALDALVGEGSLPRNVLAKAIKRYKLAADRPAPWLV